MIIRVLISSLNELLLGLFESKRADQALSITRDVDIGHIAWIINPRLPLQMMAALSVMLWVLPMTFVNWIITPVVDIRLIGD